MLQWMGGSRRKVTTSRKSTQKRQKQYFEQRKRQQQQQTTGLDSFSDGMNTCSQHQNNNRSLDILSLLNLSTVVQNCKSSCRSTRENSEGAAMTVNHHIMEYPQTIQIDKVTQGDPIEFKESRKSSGCQVEILYPKNAPDCQNRDLIGNGDKRDQLKMASEHQLSVFDLLGDDGPSDNLEVSLVNEAHVAFAVEGLGKMETETPVHSPQQPGRIFSYGCCSPLKATRHPQSPKNLNNLVYDLELEADAMIQDINLPLCGNFFELPFCSRGTENSFSKPRQKLSTAKEFSQFKSNASKLKNSFSDDEIFCNMEEKNDDIWNARCNFLDRNFLDEDCDIKWKNRSPKMDGSSADFWHLGNHEISDFAFEYPYLQKIRVAEKVTGRFNISDSPPPYSKQSRSENDRDFITADETWYPMGGRKCDIRDVTNQQAWSCFVTEDAEESLSLLSEESCSSSAVRGKATNRSPSDSVARQNIRRYGRDIRSPANKCSVENIYAKDRRYEKSDNFHEWKKIDEPGKFTKMCNPSSSNPAHYSNTTSQKKLRPENSCLFEEGYISADRDSGFGSFCQTSGAKKRASSGPMCWTEDHFGAYPLPELHANAKSSFARSIHNVLPELSPSGSFSSEKLGFCQPYSNVHSYETPVFSTIGSGRSKPNLHMDSNVEVRPQDSFPVSGSHRDAEFFCVSVEESVSKNGGNRSEILPTDCIQFELQKDVGIGSNELSSENGQSLEASGSKDNCSDCNEAKGLTPKLEGRKAMVSPEHAEEISSSVKIRCKFEGSIDEKECHNDTQTSLPRQNGSIETEDSGRKERKLESKGQDNTSVNPSCQVMMLESYVLQLLCVQKVLNEASVQGTVKKV
ncbi:uncharacterized protein LOC114260669 isoform X7 [Camellia sinensis]|uniref:uncharacterized protein LOC114260669 isoform X7 n=1 Tax=Camellia sinensis TaxID=4442 RepID=UPI0010362ED5|nr:uncharacterized protein LOC114260669 isoform X7 [Camellia sinensis]